MLKVLTFNIHHGKGTDGKLDLQRIAEVIQESKADVVGLNEVDKCFSRRSGYVDQSHWLSQKLGMYEAFGASFSLQSKNRDFLSEYGNALLSSYPIAYHANHSYRVGKGVFEGRSLLEAAVQLENRQIKVFVTHLSLSPWKRNKEVDVLIRQRKESDLPCLLMGDLNMRPGTKNWRKLTNGLRDVCGEFALSRPCLTFPSISPIIQLDYIFVNEHFRVDSVHIVSHRREASDHLPLCAAMTLLEG